MFHWSSIRLSKMMTSQPDRLELPCFRRKMLLQRGFAFLGGRHLCFAVVVLVGDDLLHLYQSLVAANQEEIDQKSRQTRPGEFGHHSFDFREEKRTEKATNDVAPRISDVLSGHLRISFCVHQRHSTVRESLPAYPVRTKSQTKTATMTTIGRWNPQLFPYRLAWWFGDLLSTKGYFSCSIPMKIINMLFLLLF